jgi:alpha-N-acetylglucosamine transferase
MKLATGAAGGGARGRDPREAYVTLLYGGFLLGARVLGQSLRETGTKKELIALCTETVSDATKDILKQDGWTIRDIQNIHSPYEGLSKRGSYFSGIFSKLHIWNMTDYDRIVYLDSDVLVVRNIDHMFDCGTFCAAFRHSDLFNAGIVVVQPNRTIFNHMLEKIEVFTSYDDGDQGFLNVYFKDLVYAPFFNWSSESRQYQPMRMPAGLNSDIGIYYGTSRWVIPDEEIRNIHYTLGPLKPWIWWTNFLFNLNEQWTNVRKRLQQYPGHNDTYLPVYLPVFWLPIPFVILLYMGVKFFDCCSSYRWTSNKYVTKMLEVFNCVNLKYSQFFPLPVVALSYYLSYKVVPTTMLPGQAEYVFWLWSNSFILVVVGLYCYLCHSTGKTPGGNHQIVPRKKLWLAILYIVFTFSYILLKAGTPMVMPFSRRVNFFFFFLALHVLVIQVTGLLLIKLLTGFKKGGAAETQANGSFTFKMQK